MALLGVDLGGTSLRVAAFSNDGSILGKESVSLQNRTGKKVGALVTEQIGKFVDDHDFGPIESIGVSVPGISRKSTGTVWAPNIPGWEDYPLHKEIKGAVGDVPVVIDSDRACYILGESWQGNAKGCRDAIFLAVGTGIGAGILIDARILRGAHDIAGAVGWMALDQPYKEKYKACGCFEHHASGEGIAKVAKEIVKNQKTYQGILRNIPAYKITAQDVFAALEEDDPIASEVLQNAIVYWGMAVANLISIFNPEKIIFGGGVFGPAAKFLDKIYVEAQKWAQPISVKMVSLETSALGGDAGIYGAGYLAWQNLITHTQE